MEKALRATPWHVVAEGKNSSAGTWDCRIGVRCDVPSRRSCGNSRRGRGPRRRLLQSEKDGASTGRGGWAGLIAARVFVVVEHNAILSNVDGICARKNTERY